MKITLLSTLKWVFIILIAGLTFYYVYPKYTVCGIGGMRVLKSNKITGSWEIFNQYGIKIKEPKSQKGDIFDEILSDEEFQKLLNKSQ